MVGTDLLWSVVQVLLIASSAYLECVIFSIWVCFGSDFTTSINLYPFQGSFIMYGYALHLNTSKFDQYFFTGPTTHLQTPQTPLITLNLLKASVNPPMLLIIYHGFRWLILMSAMSEVLVEVIREHPNLLPSRILLHSFCPTFLRLKYLIVFMLPDSFQYQVYLTLLMSLLQELVRVFPPILWHHILVWVFQSIP